MQNESEEKKVGVGGVFHELGPQRGEFHCGAGSGIQGSTAFRVCHVCQIFGQKSPQDMVLIRRGSLPIHCVRVCGSLPATICKQAISCVCKSRFPERVLKFMHKCH